MTVHFKSYQLARFGLIRDCNTTARHAWVRDNYLFEFQLDF